MLAGARRAGGPVHGDVQLVDAGQTAGEVAGEQAAQPRRHRRADDDGRPGEPGVVVEVEQGAHVVDGAGRGHDVDPAAHESPAALGMGPPPARTTTGASTSGSDEPVALLGDPAQPVGHHATADDDRRSATVIARTGRSAASRRAAVACRRGRAPGGRRR